MNRSDDDIRLQALLDAELAPLAAAPPPDPALRDTILRAIASEPRNRVPSLRETLLALWHDLGGVRLAAPALAMALAVGVGIGWTLQPPEATAEGDSEDLVALAQFDDSYSELSP